MHALLGRDDDNTAGFGNRGWSCGIVLIWAVSWAGWRVAGVAGGGCAP